MVGPEALADHAGHKGLSHEAARAQRTGRGPAAAMVYLAELDTEEAVAPCAALPGGVPPALTRLGVLLLAAVVQALKGPALARRLESIPCRGCCRTSTANWTPGGVHIWTSRCARTTARKSGTRSCSAQGKVQAGDTGTLLVRQFQLCRAGDLVST